MKNMEDFTLYKRRKDNELGNGIIKGSWPVIEIWLAKHTDTNINEVATDKHPIYAIQGNGNEHSQELNPHRAEGYHPAIKR